MALTRRRTFRTSLGAALATTTAAAATAASAPAALAGSAWCDVDPVQLVITSGGAVVPIFVTNGAPSTLYAAQLLLAKITHTVSSVDGGNASLVTVNVTVPNGLLGGSFDTRTVVTSGPLGTLNSYGVAYGRSGKTMSVQFKMAVG